MHRLWRRQKITTFDMSKQQLYYIIEEIRRFLVVIHAYTLSDWFIFYHRSIGNISERHYQSSKWDSDHRARSGTLMQTGPGMQLNSSCQDVGFISPFVVIYHTDLGATTEVARNFLQD